MALARGKQERESESMQAIFLSNDPAQLRRVYSGAVIERLEQSARCAQPVFTWADVLAAPETFRDVRAVFSTWGMPAATEEELARCLPKLQYVFYAAGTVQRFARPFFQRGVRIFHAAAANGIPVAEYAASAILLANKGFFQALRIPGRAEQLAHVLQHPGNFNARVGLIGAGKIGRLVIGLLRAHRLQLVVYDPYLPEEQAQVLGVARVSLEELFETCDVISNHLPNNAQTAGMLNYALFSRMKPWATFLNTGRGAQVVEADLVRALREKPDVTALLDVTDPEPCAPEHPFHTMKNVFLTPHIAGSLREECARMAEYMADEWDRLQCGEPPQYEVKPEALAHMA